MVCAEELILRHARSYWSERNAADAEVVKVYRLKGDLQEARAEIAALQEWIRNDSQRWKVQHASN